MKIPPVKTSVLGTPVDPPISAEEGAQIEKDHQEQWLKRLFWTAFNNHDFALALCETVAILARGDESLSSLIRKTLKKKRGGQVVRTYLDYETLLCYYAIAFEEADENAELAIERLVEYVQPRSGKRLDCVTMNNYVSKAIKKVPTDSLLEWARPAIEARRKRGDRWRR